MWVNLTIMKNNQHPLQNESVRGCADEGGASSAHDALRSSAHPIAVTFTVIIATPGRLLALPCLCARYQVKLFFDFKNADKLVLTGKCSTYLG